MLKDFKASGTSPLYYSVEGRENKYRRQRGQLLKCDIGGVPHQGAASLVRILVRLSITACDDPYQFIPARSRLTPCLHALPPDARTHSLLAIRLCGVKARLLVDPGYKGFQLTSSTWNRQLLWLSH